MIIKEHQKEVMYFGVELFVPKNGWLATDEGGEISWYEFRPIKSSSFWEAEFGGFADICTVHLDGMDWQDTLIDVEVMKQLNELGVSKKATYLIEAFDGVRSYVQSVDGRLSITGDNYLPSHWDGYELRIDEDINSLWVQRNGFGQNLGKIVKTIYVDEVKKCAK